MKLSKLKIGQKVEITGTKGANAISDPLIGTVIERDDELYIQSSDDSLNSDLDIPIQFLDNNFKNLTIKLC